MLKLLAYHLYYPGIRRENEIAPVSGTTISRACTLTHQYLRLILTLAIRSAFLLEFWSFPWSFFIGFSMHQLSESPLAQQSAVSEAVSPHTSQNREFSAPGNMCENSSMAAGDKSPSHVTSVPGNLHSLNPAG